MKPIRSKQRPIQNQSLDTHSYDTYSYDNDQEDMFVNQDASRGNISGSDTSQIFFSQHVDDRVSCLFSTAGIRAISRS